MQKSIPSSKRDVTRCSRLLCILLLLYTFYSRCASLLSSLSSSSSSSLLNDDVVKREREGKLATEYHKSGCLFSSRDVESRRKVE